MSKQVASADEQTITPQEQRQALLDELDVAKQALAKISDKQLEALVGGLNKDQKIALGVAVPASVAAVAAGCYGIKKYQAYTLAQALKREQIASSEAVAKNMHAEMESLMRNF